MTHSNGDVGKLAAMDRRTSLSLLLPSAPKSECAREAAALEALEMRLGRATDGLAVSERASCAIGAVTLVIVSDARSEVHYRGGGRRMDGGFRMGGMCAASQCLNVRLV